MGHDERLAGAREKYQRAERQVAELMASIAAMGDPPYPDSTLAELRAVFAARDRARFEYARIMVEWDGPGAP